MKISLTKLHMNRETAVVLALFVFSFIHKYTLLLALICLLYYLRQGVKGALKSLILIALRTPMSTAIAASASSVSMIKFAFIFLFSFYLITNYDKILPHRRSTVNTVLILNTLFSVFAVIGAVVNSSFPVTAIFKIVSYTVAFSAVVIGAACLPDTAELLDYYVTMALPILMLSVLVYRSSRFLQHGTLFQGLLEHPNMFGIMAALFLCAYCIRRIRYGKGSPWVVFLIFVMTFWSSSRTAMFTEIFVFLCAGTKFFPKNVRKIRILLILVMIAILLTLIPGVWNSVQNFLYKGHDEDILYSREGQQDDYEERFFENPLLGCGMNVPYIRGYYNTSLQFGLTAEPGNIIWALLGDCGVIGFILFGATMLYIIFARKRFAWDKCVLCIGPIMVCMGEMVFFSVNNIALLLYMMIACYLFMDKSAQWSTFSFLKKKTRDRA